MWELRVLGMAHDNLRDSDVRPGPGDPERRRRTRHLHPADGLPLLTRRGRQCRLPEI